ncbi:MAG: sigma-70 family RNA polymerase sigma factor, partial [Bacteroidota bacterium]
HHQGMILKMVMSNQGSVEEGHDIFQESIIVLYEQVKAGKFVLKARISTFLYAVARNLWLSRLKKKGREAPLLEQQAAQEVETAANPLERVLATEQTSMLMQFVSQLAQDCQQVLMQAIFEQRNMKDIAQRMGYRNEQIARNKKHKCIGYLKKIIQRDMGEVEALRV